MSRPKKKVPRPSNLEILEALHTIAWCASRVPDDELGTHARLLSDVVGRCAGLFKAASGPPGRRLRVKKGVAQYEGRIDEAVKALQEIDSADPQQLRRRGSELRQTERLGADHSDELRSLIKDWVEAEAARMNVADRRRESTHASRMVVGFRGAIDALVPDEPVNETLAIFNLMQKLPEAFGADIHIAPTTIVWKGQEATSDCYIVRVPRARKTTHEMNARFERKQQRATEREQLQRRLLKAACRMTRAPQSKELLRRLEAGE